MHAKVDECSLKFMVYHPIQFQLFYDKNWFHSLFFIKKFQKNIGKIQKSKNM